MATPKIDVKILKRMSDQLTFTLEASCHDRGFFCRLIKSPIFGQHRLYYYVGEKLLLNIEIFILAFKRWKMILIAKIIPYSEQSHPLVGQRKDSDRLLLSWTFLKTASLWWKCLILERCRALIHVLFWHSQTANWAPFQKQESCSPKTRGVNKLPTSWTYSPWPHLSWPKLMWSWWRRCWWSSLSFS